jgi:tetratricopeptide (TPR) repeat protein
MLYEMVCGRPPFVGDESVAIIGQHLNTLPVAPSWHRPNCPPALEALILRLLEKDPAKRPASASEVRDALKAVETARPEALEGRASASSSAQGPSMAADPLYRTVFVGREAELKQLQQAYDAAVSGQGGLVMVVGEPGIGKTAICQQLATYVSLRGGRTLVGHCYEEGSLSLPYLAFVEAMRTYVLARDPDGLKSDLGTGAADLARIVSEVRDRVAVELRDAGDPEDDRWRLLQSVTTFLRNAAAVQPLVIVLEDLHWADRGTLDLLQHVARNLQGARLVLVGTYRDVEVDRAHPLSGALAELRRSGSFLRVPLRGLTVDEVHRMYETLRGYEVPWQQAELVHRQTEGNPLFVQEVLRYLVEEGIVVREQGTYVVRGDATAIPDGLRDVIGRRLSHLDDKTNSVLSVAAVIGRDFRLDVLQKVAGLSEEDLYAALEEAQERAIIEQVQSPSGVSFRFTHAMFRTLLYEEIFAPRRIRLHQQVGRALEDIYARRLEEHAAELAEHFSQSTEAADLEKAVRYGELAAQRAMDVFAYGEAVRHLEQALRAQEVLDPDDKAKRCDLLLAMGLAQSSAGEARKVLLEMATPAFNLAVGLEDDTRASRACWLALDVLGREATGFQIGLEPEVQNWLKRLQEKAPPGSVHEAQALLTELLFGGRSFTDLSPETYEHFLNQFRAGVALARRWGDNNLVFAGAWAIISVSLSVSRWRDALALVKEIEQAPRNAVSARHLSMFLQFAASARLLGGDRSAYDSGGRELSALAERTQDGNVSLSARANEALRLVLDGHLEEAMDHAKSTFEMGQDLGIYSIAPTRSALQAAVYLGREQEVLEFDSNPTYAPFSRAFVAAFGRMGDSSFSPDERSFMEARTVSADMARFATTQALAETLARATKLADKDLVRGLLDVVDEADAFFSVPTNIFSLLRLAGNGAAMLGEIEKARRLYNESIAECEKIHHRPELALSHLDLAELLLEHYPRERDAAIEHLDFAIAELRDMKMRPALERALRHRGLLKA